MFLSKSFYSELILDNLAQISEHPEAKSVGWVGHSQASLPDTTASGAVPSTVLDFTQFMRRGRDPRGS